jgi:uncharacterized protein YdhG (YjbR/CyaY superfamily)
MLLTPARDFGGEIRHGARFRAADGRAWLCSNEGAERCDVSHGDKAALNPPNRVAWPGHSSARLSGAAGGGMRGLDARHRLRNPRRCENTRRPALAPAPIGKVSTLKSTATKHGGIDEYIAGFPKDVQKTLQQVRATIRKAAPGAEEAIKYAIPTFILDGGNLVHFAAFKNHIGFYPTPTGTEAFKKELSVYKSGKGSVQFPLDKPMPLSLIARIVKFRVGERSKKTAKKKKLSLRRTP